MNIFFKYVSVENIFILKNYNTLLWNVPQFNAYLFSFI